MKFQFRKVGLIILSLSMILGFISCGSSRPGGVSAPRKKPHRKCDCPKWTNNSLQTKHFDTWYA